MFCGVAIRVAKKVQDEAAAGLVKERLGHSGRSTGCIKLGVYHCKGGTNIKPAQGSRCILLHGVGGGYCCLHDSGVVIRARAGKWSYGEPAHNFFYAAGIHVTTVTINSSTFQCPT